MEHINFIRGIIRVRVIPADWTAQDYAFWWLPEKNGDGRVLRRARMSDKEKQQYTVAESENTLTSAGRSAVLSFLASTGSSSAFFQQFSVGTGAISSVSAADNAMATELFRKAPASNTVSGNQIDVATLFATSEGNGTWTNSGVFGGGSATSTLGTGTLYAHSLFAYSKSSAVQVSCDYVYLLAFS